MATIIPDSEDVKKAVKWISAQLEEKNNEPLAMLIEDAVFKFDLSPKEADFLTRFFGKRNADK
jgi:hypothetical protein